MRFPPILVCLVFVFAFSMIAFGQNDRMPAKNFSGVSMNGEKIELNSLKGKVVVLTFWSTRCVNCHDVIPKLNRIVQSYKDKDVVFLALTMENQAQVAKYLRKTQFNFNILPNSFGVFLKYADKDAGGNINMGFPAHFLVDRRGAIRLRTDGWDKAANLDTQIARVLGSE